MAAETETPEQEDPKVPYRKVFPHMWNDRKFRALSTAPNAQLLWVYLLTGSCTTQLPGLIARGRAALAEELGWESEDFQRCWKEIEGQGMAQADWKVRLVWVPNAVRYNPPANPNVVKGWLRPWSEIPECELKERARGALKSHMRERGENFVDAFRRVLNPLARNGSPNGSGKGSGNGMPNQEQEQEAGAGGREQEQRTAHAACDGFAFAKKLLDHLEAILGRKLTIPNRDRCELIDSIVQVLGLDLAIERCTARAPHAERDVCSLSWAFDLLSDEVPTVESVRMYERSNPPSPELRGMLERAAALEAGKRHRLEEALTVARKANDRRIGGVALKVECAGCADPAKSDVRRYANWIGCGACGTEFREPTGTGGNR